MNYKQIVQDIRVQRKLHGKYPCVISIPKNDGKIMSFPKDKMFVLTIDNDLLYFHGLTKWLKKYNEDDDFMIKLEAIKRYTRDEVNKYTTLITISTEKGLFLPISIIHGVNSTYESYNNLEYILKSISKRNIIKDDLNEGTK